MASRQNRNRQTRRKNRRRRGGNFATQFMRNNLGISVGPSTSKAADDIMKATTDSEIKDILNQKGLNIENVKRDLRSKGAELKLNLKVQELRPPSTKQPLPSHLDYDMSIPVSKSYIPSLM
jgi:hypothetical protein